MLVSDEGGREDRAAGQTGQRDSLPYALFQWTFTPVSRQGVGVTQGRWDGGQSRRASDGDAVLLSGWCGDAGQGTFALIYVGVGVADGRPIGTLQGHLLLMGPALLAAGAPPLHGLGLRGVPADNTYPEPVRPCAGLRMWALQAWPGTALQAFRSL